MLPPSVLSLIQGPRECSVTRAHSLLRLSCAGILNGWEDQGTRRLGHENCELVTGFLNHDDVGLTDAFSASP